MMKLGCRVQGLGNKVFPARYYGLIFLKTDDKIIFGIGLGKVTYFWEYGK